MYQLDHLILKSYKKLAILFCLVLLESKCYLNKNYTFYFFLFREEYNKLFDFVQSKGLKIRNATRLPDKPNYTVNQFKDSDEELDPYKESLKQDVIDRNAGSNDSDSEDGLLSFKKIKYIYI